MCPGSADQLVRPSLLCTLSKSGTMPNSFLSEADVTFAISSVCGRIDIAFVMHLHVACYGSNCLKLWITLHAIIMMPDAWSMR